MPYATDTISPLQFVLEQAGFFAAVPPRSTEENALDPGIPSGARVELEAGKRYLKPIT
jgi:hypothetical protein